jgi:hypothetical protein
MKAAILNNAMLLSLSLGRRFRALLVEKAPSFQILVFMCRPTDFLDSIELVQDGNASHADYDGGLTRCIDLQRVLRRRLSMVESRHLSLPTLSKIESKSVAIGALRAPAGAEARMPKACHGAEFPAGSSPSTALLCCREVLSSLTSPASPPSAASFARRTTPYSITRAII